MARWALGSAVTASLVVVAAGAAAQGSARDLAIRGEALRAANRCQEAVVLLRESHRIDPQPRTLVDLARCEDTIGRLTDALLHLSQARAMAHAQRLLDLETTVASMIASLAARTPRLVISFAPGTPDDVVVRREKQRLAPAEGVLLDPGDHVLEVSAGGRVTKPYPIHLEERERRSLTLTAGDPLPHAEVTPPPTPVARREVVSKPAEPAPSASSTLRTVGFVSLALGGASLGVGAVFGLVASAKKSDAQAAGCQGTLCPDESARDLRESARDSGNLATVGLVAGGMFSLAGLGLVLFASPRSRPVSISADVRSVGGVVTAKTSW